MSKVPAMLGKNLNVFNSPLLNRVSSCGFLKKDFKISLWNTCGLKSVHKTNSNTKMMSKFVNHTFNDETKIDKIVTCISFDNPDLILFTETHLLSDPKNPKHPLPAIKKLYKHFALGCCASNSGGIAILSKNPIIVHYTHKSGNLIHFSVVDDMNNSIPFIHCYASPSRRQYYYRLILKRSNIIPESIITGDLNTDVINDSYFKSLIFNPLCLTPNQDLATSKPTFFPRGKGNPKSLDWILLPPSFLDFNVSTSLLPQTSPPISDHLLVTVTLKHNNVDDQNSNFQKRKCPISTSLFRKKEIQEVIKLASERFVEDYNNEPVKAVDSFRYHVFCLLRDLTMNQAKENKALVNEVKQLSSSNSPISKEISERLNEIIVERIQSTKDRFYKFIAQSRHSPSKAMTLMSSEASTSKRPRIEDADAHLKFWTDHFTHTDSYNHTPCELSRVTDYFFSFINDKVLSSEASSRLSREITTEEVELVIKVPVIHRQVWMESRTKYTSMHILP